MTKRRKDDETPSIWRLLWMLLMAFIMPACATDHSHTNYDEINERYEAATTDEEREHFAADIERFEELAEKAERHYEIRSLCMNNAEVVWHCRDREYYSDRKPPKTLQERVDAYRRDRFSCGCVRRRDLNIL